MTEEASMIIEHGLLPVDEEEDEDEKEEEEEDDQMTEEASIIGENEPGDVDELQVYKKKRSLEDIEEEEEDKRKPRPVRSTSVGSPSTTIVIEDDDEEEDKNKSSSSDKNNLSTLEIDDGDFEEDPEWILVGRKSVVSLSTTKGMKLVNNEIVHFTFPDREKLSSMPASSKAIAAASTTVRFSTKRCGQIGKLKPEWASFLIPLVNSSMVKICGRCIAAPMNLSYYQDINLYVSFYINRSVFTESDVSLCDINPSNIHSVAAVVAPLMKLINCLKIKPSTDAISTPGDLDPKKCVINTQALRKMTQLEKRMNAETLHPFWEEYKLCNEKYIYVNIFSGEATTQFPKSTSTTRGGILVDAMGLLGKTDLLIDLILSRPLNINKNTHEESKRNGRSKVKGGTLVICPISVFSRWKDEIETRSKQDAIGISVYFGGYRCTNDPNIIREHDAVLTSYDVVTETFRNDGECSIFQKVEWKRIILDESNTIKAWKTIEADAIFNLSSQSRWCLTGSSSDHGNNLEDVYNHLRFLRIEPWFSNMSWWEKNVASLCKSDDSKGMKMLRGVLGAIVITMEDTR
ncbi:DNA repair protein RAD5B-like isoform X2 [Impatiens glandulifera]|uniref:DNA repair protein RAD5B-like isoform X2 n=1 Tax=Impatiens glandulifera TaxID=253017 RepID=UPI001FB063AD|nr:DNA repair protein RAD5B-like isoform X2 [Impatiens glandulifera]